MKKVLMVDYYGMCDKNGLALGHSLKVLREYTELIKEKYCISVALSPCLAIQVEKEYDTCEKLMYDINVESQGIVKRIFDKLKLFWNIKQVLKKEEYDIVWFYRTDFFLFFFLCFQRKKINQKLVGLIYQNKFAEGILGKVLNLFYERGIKKFNAIIYTQKGMEVNHPNRIYIPDYYYDEKKYQKYKDNAVPKEYAVCLGTMNPYKQLEKLVCAFNNNGMPLIIKGSFYNKELFQRLLEMKRDNIIIEDIIIEEDEYYKLLAECKYSILPYDMSQYAGRTSGVLLECFFLDAVPVAPRQLLEANGVYGLGYEEIDELSFSSFFVKQLNRNRVNKKLEVEYKKENIKRNVLRLFDEL